MPKNISGTDPSHSDGVFSQVLVNTFAAQLNSSSTGFIVYNSISTSPLFKIDGSGASPRATFYCDLDVIGSASFTSVSNIAVTSSMMSLATGNTAADLIDIGFYGLYNSGGNKYRGLVKSVSLGRWVLFKDIVTVPSTTVTLDGSWRDTLEVQDIYFNGDGSTLSALQTTVGSFPEEIKNLTTAEIQQLENIGALTISAAQWTYLSQSNQRTDTAGTPSFSGLTLSTGVLSLPASLVETPSLNWGDSATGIYRPGTNQLGISVSGTNVGTWSSTGLTMNTLAISGVSTLTATTLQGTLNSSSASQPNITTLANLESLGTLPGTITIGSSGAGVSFSNSNLSGIRALTVTGGAISMTPSVSSSSDVSGFILSPTVANGTSITNGYGIYSNPVFTASNLSSITNTYALYIDDGSETGLGTVPNAYGGYFRAPTYGVTSNMALYTDNINIGYTAVTPPTNGLIISGRIATGTSSPTANNRLTIAYAASSDLVGIRLQGTMSATGTALYGIFDSASYTIASSFNWAAYYNAAAVTLASGYASGSIYGSWISPSITNPASSTATITAFYGESVNPIVTNAASGTSLTITNYYCQYIGARITNSGTTMNVTNLYGLFVAAPVEIGTVGGTMAYGAYIIAPTSATGNCALFATNACIGTYTGITPSTGSLYVSGQIATGTSAPTANYRLTVSYATTDIAALYIIGTSTASGSLIYGIINASTCTLGTTRNYFGFQQQQTVNLPANYSSGTIIHHNVTSSIVHPASSTSTIASYAGESINSTISTAGTALTITAYQGINILPILTQTAGTFAITNYYGIRVQAPTKTGSITGTAAYSGYFTAPALATANTALYADDCKIGITTAATATSALLVSNSGSNNSKITLAGAALNGSTTTDGIALTMTNNGSANRQLAIADSALLANSSSNPTIRIMPNSGTIDAMATDSSTILPLTIGNLGNTLNLNSLSFGSNSPGSSSATFCHRLTGTANWLSGGTAIGQLNQHVFTPTISSSNLIALYSQNTFTIAASTTATNVFGYNINCIYNISAAAAVITNLYALNVQGGSQSGGTGAGSSITNAYGIYVSNPAVGTNKVALYTDNLAIGTTGTAPPTNGILCAGQIRNSSGSVGAPSYSFSAGTNAGIYYTTDILNFATAGTYRGQIDSNGLLLSNGGALYTSQTNASGYVLHWILRTSSATRWIFGLSGTESGSNAGSNFALLNYNDAGSLLGEAFNIRRSDNKITFGGFIGAPDGSAAAPSYSFSSQSSTGLYYTANAINFTCAGTKAFTVTNLSVDVSSSVVFTTTQPNIAGDATHWLMKTTANRWGIGMQGTESGSNAGSNLVFFNYSDAGNFLVDSLIIRRSDNKVTITGPVSVSTVNDDVNGNLTSGTYTPVFSSLTAGVSTVTATGLSSYQRIGSRVHCIISCSITPVNGFTSCGFQMSLPANQRTTNFAGTNITGCITFLNTNANTSTGTNMASGTVSESTGVTTVNVQWGKVSTYASATPSILIFSFTTG